MKLHFWFPFGFHVKRETFHVGFQTVSLWLHFGNSVWVPLAFHVGFQTVSLWLHFGLRLGSTEKAFHVGFKRVSLWLHFGNSVWVPLKSFPFHVGFQTVSLWLHFGLRLGSTEKAFHVGFHGFPLASLWKLRLGSTEKVSLFTLVSKRFPFGFKGKPFGNHVKRETFHVGFHGFPFGFTLVSSLGSNFSRWFPVVSLWLHQSLEAKVWVPLVSLFTLEKGFPLASLWSPFGFH